ncbi:MAG: DUF3604 domain-containing protein [Armatimonadota bacterium]
MTEYGHITMSPRDDIVAGSTVTLTFEYTVGEKGIKEGGQLRIATPNDAWQWPEPPMRRFIQKGHETGGYDNGLVSYSRKNTLGELETDTNARIELEAQERAIHFVPNRDGGGWAHNIVAHVRDGDLERGDVIRITYGDTTWGEDGVEAQKVVPTPKDRFHAYVDVEGDHDFYELPGDELEITVLPTPPGQINVVAPAIVRPGEEFDIKIAVMDEFRNRPDRNFAGEMRLGSDHPCVALPGSVAFAEEDANRKDVDGASTEVQDVHRITAERADGRGWRYASNPVWVTRREMNIYFGDLHCQSKYHSDSIGTPAEGYAYGRDVALLDFMGITDSSGHLKEDGWQETQEATRDFYAPGEFVTFKAFEFGGHDQRGHHNVIFREFDEIEPVIEELRGADYDTFFEYLREREDEIMAIPHHTKSWTDWDAFAQDMEPLVEVYSCWGSGVEHQDPLWEKSEKPGSGVFAALDRGYRFGFIGCGDSHSGMPGRSYPQDRQWCVMRKSGFTGVYAPELTREAIFDALQARRTYATTGVRMILEFSVNDVPMGGELDLDDPETERVIRIHAIGEGPIEYMKIVKNNEDLMVRECSGEEEYFEFVDTDPAEDGDWYYVRVVQEDEETGWSSPVWVNVG